VEHDVDRVLHVEEIARLLTVLAIRPVAFEELEPAGGHDLFERLCHHAAHVAILQGELEGGGVAEITGVGVHRERVAAPNCANRARVFRVMSAGSRYSDITSSLSACSTSWNVALVVISIGAGIGGTAGLLAGLGLLAIPGLGPVVAAGWLAATAVGAAAGAATGGIIGALTEAGVSEEDAHTYAEGVLRGGTLVTARVPDSDRAKFERFLDQSSVKICDRRAMWQKSGWQRFDSSKPYGVDEVRKERELYTGL